MSMTNEFDMVFNGVKMTVVFEVSGPCTTGDEMELTQVNVRIGDEDVTDILADKVLVRIDEECFKHLPEGPEPERED